MTFQEQLVAAMEKARVIVDEFTDKALPEEKQTELTGYLDQADALRKQIESTGRLNALKKFHNEAATHLPLAGSGMEVTDEADRFLDSDEGKFANLGEQMAAVKQATVSPIAGMDKRLAMMRQKQLYLKQTGMSEGVPADGGFLVQQQISAELFMLAHSDGEILRRVRKIPIGPNANGLVMNAIAEAARTTGNRWGGIQSYWLGEAGTKLPSHPTFRQMHLNLRKLITLVYATDELLQDTTALGNIVTQAASEDIRWMIEEAVFNGIGGGQPLGIMGHASLITQAAEAGQAANTVVFENIVNMYSRRWAPSWTKMIWFINQDIEPQLLDMNAAVGAGGTLVYLPPGGLSGAPYATMMGRPVIATEHNATLGTTGDIALFDLSQYLTIDKGGLQSATSIHVAFLTDEQVFRFVYRIDGQPLWNTDLTPANSVITQSPFIVLATRP